jgi:DNA-binding transcriptional MerR regulator
VPVAAPETGRGAKAPDAFRTISEVAEDIDVPQHVLRFWETRFPQIKPLKRGGGRRYYRREDVDLVRGIRALLYGQGYTIKGVQRILREGGVRNVQAVGRGEAQAPEPPAEAAEAAAPGPRPDLAEPAPIEPPAARPPAAGFDADGRAVLAAALAELRECRRVLAGLRATPEDG